MAGRRVLAGKVDQAKGLDKKIATPRNLVLRPSLKKNAWMLVASIAFVAIGILAVLNEETKTGLLVLGFFSICAVVLSINLMPGASWLRLTNEGFHFRTLYREPKFIAWKSVSRFRVSEVSDETMVVYTSEKGAQSALAPMNAALTGHTEALPNTFGESPEELAKLMNEWRERAVRDEQRAATRREES